MPRIWRLSAAAALLVTALALTVAPAGPAAAQEPTAAENVTTTETPAPADTAQTTAAVEPGRRKHPNLFGVTVHGQWRLPIKVLKEDNRNINDIFAAAPGFGAGVRWYALDGMALSARYSRGGLEMTDNAYDLATVAPGLTGEEYVQLDALTVAVAAYFGGALMPDSRFNPYLQASYSRYDWAFATSGRDSDPYVILDTAVEGKDSGVGFGLGTEIALGGGLLAELDWAWNYVLTELDQTDGVFAVWTNTHFWSLSAGLVWTF